MSRKLGALLLAGTFLLSACGSEADSSDGAGAVPTPVESVAAADLNLVSGTATTNEAEPGTGDWTVRQGGPAPEGAGAEKAKAWVQLTVSTDTALKQVVVNGSDLTLYRFDKDTAAPSKSACNDDCAKTWPPVLFHPGMNIYLAGVKPEAVGVVLRDDRTVQLTIAGWPIYRFAGNKDKPADKPRDTNGHGVGGTWFGITPDGKKAELKDNTPKPVMNEPEAKPGDGKGTAIFFTEKSFAEKSYFEILSGPGCKNLDSTANEASSVVATGSMKIWAGKDCTGKSFTINGDVSDLAETGLDNDVESVRFL
ncbi:hypothetical protein [Catenuloplanes japonicus]|uniref:hypothetical protein n=1 Tax=Catenuloplanes japonicus TaxID=33876 RepID=UPI000525BC36|nr:hypothetical protein [Catenuloplanes japonicus]